ncbi:hypothetical protein L580_0541 [Serratia fonticola AU-P3(3)]|nr:hypothetical protein L581_0377 [Serratia fonticola AU-AP2C]ERK16961.1 hypothetical protein L580_0541 [Serratia fonticola AU-P3(3)]
MPFYYSPTLEFVAGDPAKAVKVTKPQTPGLQPKRLEYA